MQHSILAAKLSGYTVPNNAHDYLAFWASLVTTLATPTTHTAPPTYQAVPRNRPDG